ncbi:hypothetical protein ICM05_05475 [Leucobacter sp. cx-42]|uniref:DUF6630 family protein n=1 Tax=unclassified Leucobacter TaxID=2621730 RepID=UPI00165D44B9|nr:MULTISPECIES: DUF6630 family protein [unclassified Leucobacter]MBC9954096.1 hypothetical protein [Leucobacter sp. cx-42]
MGFFDLFKKQKPGIAQEPQAAGASPSAAAPIDYSPLIEMAAIISNGDAKVATDITLLATDPAAFSAQHREWLADFGYEADEELGSEEIRDIFAYWLVGYETPFEYGAYIDWKEAPEEITAQLDAALEKLGYPLTTAEIAIEETGTADDTMTALSAISNLCEMSGFALAILDTESDSYHLFIVPAESYDRLVALAESLDYRVYSAD